MTGPVINERALLNRDPLRSQCQVQKAQRGTPKTAFETLEVGMSMSVEDFWETSQITEFFFFSITFIEFKENE